MILVRNIFQAKFGKAGELANGFKENVRQMGDMYGSGSSGRVLTDLSGQFDTVVWEIQVESLGVWEQRRAEAFSRPEFREGFARTAALIESGRSEFYTIES